MVLTTRAIDPVQVHSDAYTKAINSVLDTVAAEKLVGLLKQIGQLSDFAADIFQNLFKDATQSYTRIGALGSRIGILESSLPAIQSIFENNPPEKFYSAFASTNFQRVPRPHEQLFTLDNMPEPIARVRQSAQSPPNVSALDDFAGKKCLASYSDPDLFFNLWLKEEEQRLAKLQEENKAKRANRKKKKKVDPKQQKQVAAVQVKSYSAQGKEFEITPANNNSGTTASDASLPPPPEDDSNAAADEEEVASLSSFNLTQQQQPKPYTQQSQQTYQPPPAPEISSIPIPDAPAFDQSPPPIPPPIFDIPQAPQINIPTAPPIEIPLAPAFDAPQPPPLNNPSAPAPPPLTTSPSAAATRPGGLLGQIQGGVQLRKAEPAAAKPVDARGGLLGEIKNRNFQLRKINKEEEKAKAIAADKGGLSSIMAVLARRQAIANESDESEGEEEWN